MSSREEAAATLIEMRGESGIKERHGGAKARRAFRQGRKKGARRNGLSSRPAKETTRKRPRPDNEMARESKQQEKKADQVSGSNAVGSKRPGEGRARHKRSEEGR